MYYALFDFEHDKDIDPYEEMRKYSTTKKKYFMRNPELYRLGMDSTMFSLTIFCKWFAYGLWHAGVVYFTCYHFLA